MSIKVSGGGGGGGAKELDAAYIANVNNAETIVAPYSTDIPVDTVTALSGTCASWDGILPRASITETGTYTAWAYAYFDGDLSGFAGVAVANIEPVNTDWQSRIGTLPVDKNSSNSPDMSCVFHVTVGNNPQIGVNLILGAGAPSGHWGYDLYLVRVGP